MPVFFQTGFRPFFLLGALLVVVAMPWWGLYVVGSVDAPGPLMPLHWHVHEMVIGFSGAVLSGFLLTAAAKWTKRTTATGAALVLLVGAWVLGRLAVHVDLGLPMWLVAIPDAAWLGGLTVAVLRPIVLSKSWRNLGLAAVPLTLGVAHGTMLLTPEHAAWGWRLGLDAVILALVIVSGRIVPLFTGNALGVKLTRYPGLERSAVLATCLLLVADAVAAPIELTGVAAVLAGGFSLTRAVTWHTLQAMRRPLLGVLHVGTAGLGIGLIAVGFSRFGLGPGTAGLHVLTVGAIAMLCLGMMARVALGHTGRTLKSPMLATAAFSILGCVAVVRPMAELPGARETALLLAALGFGASFVLYLAHYTRILVGPRADGKPG
ncbi:MAG: NnrS family protein [Proteobacteria bacterium]|nr:NnrS family protein [Pseudomonadota bacterium]MCP4916545.1 NnrS family protein [Pseudomonadota bacterium]